MQRDRLFIFHAIANKCQASIWLDYKCMKVIPTFSSVHSINLISFCYIDFPFFKHTNIRFFFFVKITLFFFEQVVEILNIALFQAIYVKTKTIQWSLMACFVRWKWRHQRERLHKTTKIIHMCYYLHLFVKVVDVGY